MVVDVAIVGGGPAGLALAGMLERAGISFVVYERGARDETPRGGCLDLHIGSGQRAMKEAGCFEMFRKHGRLGEATVHWVYDHNCNKVFSWGEGRDAPEIDRSLIKKCLLSTFPDEKIQWRKILESASRNEQGKIELKFTDRTEASGFKLIVGADGINSKIRPLITEATPQYSGMQFLTAKILRDNPYYPHVEKLVGHGPMVVMGRATKIWNQRQGDGHYRLDFGFIRREDFATNGPVDINDTEAVKKLLLTDDFFGQHAPEIKAYIQNVDGPFRSWPLYVMPTAALNWEAQADVTLIGDAAHTTTPFVGDGANCAMHDSVILSQALKKYGITRAAIAEYEKDMFVTAIDVIERSQQAGYLFFDWRSPYFFAQEMQKKPLIGTTDEI
ncbi:hypothetical protein BKA61DRAFT_662173 [Leptodontidium sp. MPI-SDFR-AT-0119]|nr:hypothetical protein BKA61DRAFT_662173 [Leptodontidium sp. MPI-SDFR-AT-0119]